MTRYNRTSIAKLGKQAKDTRSVIDDVDWHNTQAGFPQVVDHVQATEAMLAKESLFDALIYVIGRSDS
ncbi:MAG: hypothetical protein EBU84_20130, partial [Actinobacteria bacterium]|nr:hypothetical protein [Actinomycetota bacterium]